MFQDRADQRAAPVSQPRSPASAIFLEINQVGRDRLQSKDRGHDSAPNWTKRKRILELGGSWNIWR